MEGWVVEETGRRAGNECLVAAIGNALAIGYA
jgi:hypothetical protein